MQIGDRVRRRKDPSDIRVGTIIDIQQKSGIAQIKVQWGKRSNWHNESSVLVTKETPLASFIQKYHPDINICNQALPHSSIGIIEDSEKLYKICALFSRNKKTLTHGFQELIIDRHQLVKLQNSIQRVLKSS